MERALIFEPCFPVTGSFHANFVDCCRQWTHDEVRSRDLGPATQRSHDDPHVRRVGFDACCFLEASFSP